MRSRPEDTGDRTDGPAPTPPARRLLRERALQAVRDAISSGRLAPGSRLTERQLCEDHRISRTIAREVVRQLESERLVDVVPHRGLRIAQLTPKRVQEIYAIRTELEVLVVRSFIASATAADVADLRTIFDRLRAAHADEDLDRIVDEATAFLWHMIRVADNRVAAEVLDQLLARINMLRMMSMRMPGRVEASIVQIAGIVEAIVARDTAAAERAVRDYVEAAGRSALRYLETRPDPA